MKHTAGPWKYVKDLSAIVIISEHKVKTIADFGKIEHHEANANLIATAPELLAACEYTIEKLKGVKGKAFPIMPILNAIAKARGK